MTMIKLNKHNYKKMCISLWLLVLSFVLVGCGKDNSPVETATFTTFGDKIFCSTYDETTKSPKLEVIFNNHYRVPVKLPDELGINHIAAIYADNDAEFYAFAGIPRETPDHEKYFRYLVLKYVLDEQTVNYNGEIYTYIGDSDRYPGVNSFVILDSEQPILCFASDKELTLFASGADLVYTVESGQSIRDLAFDGTNVFLLVQNCNAQGACTSSSVIQFNVDLAGIKSISPITHSPWTYETIWEGDIEGECFTEYGGKCGKLAIIGTDGKRIAL